MKFISVGFNNIINAERVVAVVSSESAPAKRLIQDARDSGRAIDCTCGRKNTLRGYYGFGPHYFVSHTKRNNIRAFERCG